MQCCELWTHGKAWRKYWSLFLDIVKKGKGEKWKFVQIAFFPLIFVTDLRLNALDFSSSLNDIGSLFLTPMKKFNSASLELFRVYKF